MSEEKPFVTNALWQEKLEKIASETPPCTMDYKKIFASTSGTSLNVKSLMEKLGIEKSVDLESDEENEIVELIDENGESTVFEHLATIEYEGETYLALSDPESQEEDLEVFILKIDQDENGEDVYNVPDDDIADAVFAKLVQLTEDLDQDDE